MTESDNEYVILGNDALMKCDIPSFVSDLIEIQSWIDSEENIYLKNSYSSSFGTYYLRNWLLKILAWPKYFCFKQTNPICVCLFYFSVVHQDYSSEASNEYVIVGNDALMKCIVPSFVSDLVEIIAWTDTEENIFYKQSSDWGTSTILKSIFF